MVLLRTQYLQGIEACTVETGRYKDTRRSNNKQTCTIRTLLFQGGTPFYSFWEFFSIVMGPYLLIHFFLFPAPLLVLGEYLGTGYDMYISAVKNLFLAELLTNIHGFVAIVTNHAGDDMYRFRDGCRPYSG